MATTTKRLTASASAYVEVATGANRVTILPQGGGAYRYAIAAALPAFDAADYIVVADGGRTVLDGMSSGDHVFVRSEDGSVTLGVIAVT